jgi:ferredoxin
MSVKKVWLDENENECISCSACEDICPEVFSVPEKMVVKPGVNFGDFEAEIKDAAESCPVEVIKYS